MTDYKNLKDVAQVAGILSIGESTVRELIKCGKIKAFRVGVKKAIRIPQAEIERYLRDSIIDPMEV